MSEITCRYCGSTDTFKDGLYHGTYVTTQKYRCGKCYRSTHIRTKKIEMPIPPETPNNFSWASYNEAQVREKLLFLELLDSLCSHIPDELQGNVGRPSASFREMVFCVVGKLYEGLSSRRVSSDLTIAMQKGYIVKVPHFNTLIKYFNDTRLIPVLTDLIRLSAMPLKDLENTFAVDASGLSSAFYSRWFDYRFGNLDGKQGKAHDWIKIHVICGVKTNIVTAIKVTEGTVNDSPQFPELVSKTAEHFRVKEVCADKGYSGRDNIDAAFKIGAVPYIPFKTNSTGKARGTKTWHKMFHYFQLHQDKFMERYHQRSTAEGTFSMLKRKFSTKLRSKNEVAQINEALAMVLCHNLCVLVREIFENGIETEFEEFAHLFNSLHTNSVNEPQ